MRKSSLSDCTLPHTTTVFLFKVNSEPFVHKTEISSFRVLQGERGMRRNVLTEVSVALFFYVGLRLPVIFRLPFLVFDLACLVCIVQIKVVSTSFPACTRRKCPAGQPRQRGLVHPARHFYWCLSSWRHDERDRRRRH